jgi:hypothetical protein
VSKSPSDLISPSRDECASADRTLSLNEVPTFRETVRGSAIALCLLVRRSTGVAGGIKWAGGVGLHVRRIPSEWSAILPQPPTRLKDSARCRCDH